jgi:hypothetical protein
MTMRRYSSRLFAAGGVVPMPVTFSMSGDGSSARVSVVNDSADWLRGAWVWREGRAWPLGDIAPGSAVSRAISADDSVDPRSVNGSDQRVDFWNLVSPGVDSSPGILVAWLDEAALRYAAPGARHAPDRPSLSLLLVEAS